MEKIVKYKSGSAKIVIKEKTASIFFENGPIQLKVADAIDNNPKIEVCLATVNKDTYDGCVVYCRLHNEIPKAEVFQSVCDAISDVFESDIIIAR